jgi:hypothetical protein
MDNLDNIKPYSEKKRNDTTMAKYIIMNVLKDACLM